MDYGSWAAAPAPALRRHVARYLGYRIVGAPAGVHRGLPSARMTLIASIGAPIDVVAQVDPRQAPAAYRVVVGGLQSGPALIRHAGALEGVVVELSPVGARALLGLPAGALAEASHELADVIGPAGDRLWEELQATATRDERVAALDAALLRLLRLDDPLEPALRRAFALLAGGRRVGEVAATIGWSRQHLARRFAAEYGIAPSLAVRVARLERAHRRLGTAPLAAIAADAGFADQAHMTREFAALAGCSPARLVADDLPSVQDDGSVPLASSAA